MNKRGRNERRSQPASHRASRRQHSAAGRRDRVPHRVGRRRPAPRSPARRRDRHPQDLDPVPAGRARRQSRDRACVGRAAVQVRPVGRQGGARNPAPAGEARRHARRQRRSRPAMPRWRSNRGACSTGCSRRASFPPTVKFQICIPTPIAPTYNNMVPADRPKLLPALTRAFHRRGREDRAGASERPHRAAMGRVPGSAGLGGLLRAGPGRFPHRDHRRAHEGRRRRAGRRSSSAIICATAARPTSTWCSRRTPGIMVEIANAIAASVERPIQFFHMPVPKARTDDAYFAPLESLQLGAETELYLGLIHHDDASGRRGPPRRRPAPRPRRRRRHRMRHGARRSRAPAVAPCRACARGGYLTSLLL